MNPHLILSWIWRIRQNKNPTSSDKFRWTDTDMHFPVLLYLHFKKVPAWEKLIYISYLKVITLLLIVLVSISLLFFNTIPVFMIKFYLLLSVHQSLYLCLQLPFSTLPALFIYSYSFHTLLSKLPHQLTCLLFLSSFNSFFSNWQPQLACLLKLFWEGKLVTQAINLQ